MNLLRRIFFFIPYPGALIWHIILGSIIAALIGVVAFGYNGYGYVWLPVSGAVLAIIVGLLLARK